MLVRPVRTVRPIVSYSNAFVCVSLISCKKSLLFSLIATATTTSQLLYVVALL